MSAEATKPLAYIDSSAAVKLILAEPESAELVAYIEGMDLVSSRLLETEALRAIKASAAGKEAEDRLSRVLDAVHIVEISPHIAGVAGRLEPPSLRTLDAIHLATALVLREDLGTMIVFDQRLAEAAGAAGIEVAAPGRASQG